MSVIILDQVSVAYGDKPLLDQANFIIEPGERVAIVGRNGAGKSTLLKVLMGKIDPESGNRRLDKGLAVSVLQQDLPAADDQTVYHVVAGGLGRLGSLLEDFQTYSQAGELEKMAAAQTEIEAQDGWKFEQKINSIIDRLKLPASKKMAELSGGWRRRVMLGRALVSEPDLLLLDEPTNHLDIPAIEWLEQQLLDFQGALVFITHDRTFLKALATRIVELDRGNLFSYPGNYDKYLELKEKRLEDEAKQNELFDKKLAEEEVWIRQGIKARRTRNEGRVRALKALRQERKERRDVQGKASFQGQSGEKSGKLVAELTNVSHGFEGKNLITDFSTTIMRGDRIGLVGVNGVGKSTLLKIVLGELQPNEGQIRLGTKLEVSYFDQLRNQLDLEKSVIDNISQGRDFIEVNGQNKHLISYLGDFLFTAERARTPVKALSGGETNRVLLAKLFSKPANLLVLDEPTNDLDVETLDLLEEILMGFEGTLLIVSHDREFLDNVVTSTIVFEGNGILSEHVGGYSDWVGKGNSLADLLESSSLSGKSVGEQADAKAIQAKGDKVKEANDAPKKPKKLSYKLQLELDQLPAKLEELEANLESLQEETGAPDFYQMEHSHVSERLQAMEEAEAALESAMERWVELEAMQSGE